MSLIGNSSGIVNILAYLGKMTQVPVVRLCLERPIYEAFQSSLACIFALLGNIGSTLIFLSTDRTAGEIQKAQLR